MKLKKVLTGTALSLLVSAAPAFAASPTDTHSEESQTKEVSALGTLVVRDFLLIQTRDKQSLSTEQHII